MGRLMRLAAIFGLLLLGLSLLALWRGEPHAGPLAAGLLVGLAALAGAHLRGRAPGFTQAERARIFGHPGD